MFRKKTASQSVANIVLVGVVLGAMYPTPLAHAQQPSAAVPESSPLPAFPPGLRLYDVLVFYAYDFGNAMSATSSIGSSPGFNSYSATGQVFGGAATMGWTHTGPRDDMQLTYSPSWYSSAGGFHSLSHQLQGQANRRLTSRLTLSTYVNAFVADFNSYSFYGTASAPGGDLTRQSDASSPAVSSARTLLFGSRMLNANLGTGLAWAYSPRLSLNASIGGTRYQNLSSHVSSSGAMPADSGQYLIRSVTTGDATLGATYEISPHTSAGLNIMSARTWTSFGNASYTSASVTVSRHFAEKWAAEGHLGSGVLTSGIKTIGDLKPQIVGGANVFRHQQAQTFGIGFERSGFNDFGLIGGSNLTLHGSWQWTPAQSNWSLSADGGWNWFDSVQLPTAHANAIRTSLDSWNGGVSVGRFMGQHVILQLQAAYAAYGVPDITAQKSHSGEIVRMALTWSPAPRFASIRR